MSLSVPGSWKFALSRVASAIDIPPGGACVSTEKGDCGNMGTNINKAGFTPGPAVLDHSLVAMLRFVYSKNYGVGGFMSRTLISFLFTSLPLLLLLRERPS